MSKAIIASQDAGGETVPAEIVKKTPAARQREKHGPQGPPPDGMPARKQAATNCRSNDLSGDHTA